MRPAQLLRFIGRFDILRFMSKPLPSTDLVIPAQRKSQLISQETADSWLSEVSTGKDLFQSVIPSSVATKIFKPKRETVADAIVLPFSLTLVGTMGAVLAGLFVPGNFEGALDHLNLLGQAGLFLGPATVIGGVGGLFGNRIGNKKLMKRAVVQAFQEKGLRNWLKARYGIDIHDETLSGVAGHLLEGKESSFVDKTGRGWLIRPSGSGAAASKWLVEEQKIVQSTEASTIAVIDASEIVLPGEAQTLYDSITARVTMLDSYNLTVESSHTVRRAEQEAKQVVASYQKLEALNESASGEAALVEVLAAVNEELLEVAQVEAASVRSQMAVQSNYLQEKKAAKGFSTLKLPVVEDRLTPVLEVEKKVVGN